MVAPTDLSQSGFLDSIVKFFASNSAQGLANIYPNIISLIGSLAIIDLASSWYLYEGQLKISNVISRLMKIFAFLFMLYYWSHPLPGISLPNNIPATIPNVILLSFSMVGMKASGHSFSEGLKAYEPSFVLDQAFIVLEPIFKDLTGLSILKNGFGRALIELLVIVGVFLAFFLMALQLALAKIEFYIFSTLAAVLIPFGLFKKTDFLWKSVFPGLCNFGMKLMVLYFIMGVMYEPVFATTKLTADSSFSKMLVVVASCLVMGLLVWKLPELAMMMISGQSQMEGGRMAAGTAAGVAKTAWNHPKASKAVLAAAAGAGAGAGLAGLAGGALGGAAIGGFASTAGGFSGMAYASKVGFDGLVAKGKAGAGFVKNKAAAGARTAFHAVQTAWNNRPGTYETTRMPHPSSEIVPSGPGGYYPSYPTELGGGADSNHRLPPPDRIYAGYTPHEPPSGGTGPSGNAGPTPPAPPSKG
ncbi:type IV secretion system protein [Acidaminococcus sp. HCP3S3_G9_1]|uniref:type IV secretion system protein n=1 Tax=Acidaminococcus sp. HCP3S3_G9_1 TaxID=3438732 RepID=UPI003F8F3202